MMSIARLSAGAGYQYLLRHTACGDVPRDPAQSLTTYYTESGYPPGTWWGAGLDGLGSGDTDMASGTVVTEEAMGRLFGCGHDPATDGPLGRPYPKFRSTSERIDHAITALPAGMSPSARADAVQAITRTESGRRTRSAVAGFDLTFTARKSASVLWALADPGNQALVVAAHRAAVRDTLALLEERAVFTRVGARSCAQVPTRGVIAAVFDHWDTRTGDPNLHSHVVIANKVQGLDGLWRSLDSRALHHATVAFSEVYDNLLADRLAEVVPVTWSYRDRGPRRTPAYEIDGVPDAVLHEFSARSAAIAEAMTAALSGFHATHGRAPTRVETTRLRQRLTLASRPPKTVHRLPELIRWWRQRAASLLERLPDHVLDPLLAPLSSLRDAAEVDARVRRRSGGTSPSALEATDAVRRLEIGHPRTPGELAVPVRLLDSACPPPRSWPPLPRPEGVRAAWSSSEIPDEVIAQLAATALESVMERRSTWTRWNLLAEAARATRPIRCSTGTDRHALHDRVVSAALAECVCLEAPDVFTAPPAFQREGGVSMFARPGEDVYSHRSVLDAESRLLAALDDLSAPVADPGVAAAVAQAPQPPRRPDGAPVRLASDQASAVVEIATSGRRVDVLVGPAGTGKTTTLRALRTVWETRYGHGSVTGLAPSAAAAHELATALGIGCENTAKWLFETTGPAGRRRHDALEGLRSQGEDARRCGDTSAATGLARAATEVQATGAPWSMRAGQLVVVDEASLAGTLTLDTLREQATAAGAKLLLVGDHQQLSAVDAGGAFGLLAATPDAHELRSLWRFTQRWEAYATRRLRHGDPGVLAAYEQHERITAGTSDEVLDAAYDAWALDQTAGLSALLLAADTTTVDALNDRAHQERVAAGAIDPASEVRAADGMHVCVGDVILTRRNDRRLLTSAGQHVRNGDRWTISTTHADGSVTATRDQPHHPELIGEEVRLPAAYVQDHVELGYATTVHRAQGVTVERAHVLVTPGMSRQALYVAMTRGSSGNRAYVALDRPDADCLGMPDPGIPEPTAREILTTVLARSDREVSATETLRERQDAATTPARLLPIRDTLQTGSPWALNASQPTAETTADPAIAAAIAEIDEVLRTSRGLPAQRIETTASSSLQRAAVVALDPEVPELDMAALGSDIAVEDDGWAAIER